MKVFTLMVLVRGYLETIRGRVLEEGPFELNIVYSSDGYIKHPGSRLILTSVKQFFNS